MLERRDSDSCELVGNVGLDLGRADVDVAGKTGMASLRRARSAGFVPQVWRSWGRRSTVFAQPAPAACLAAMLRLRPQRLASTYAAARLRELD